MPIELVRFEKLFPTVQYGNELFVMEGHIGPGETKESLYDEMHQTAIKQFYKNNPHLQEGKTTFLNDGTQLDVTPTTMTFTDRAEYGPTEPEKPQPKQTIEQATIAQINEVTDKTVLESFLLIAKKYPAIKEAYDKRLKEITIKK